MVYKKYITRNGKTFGPYYYESYRDKNGNVKSRFISGPTQKDKVAMKFNNKKFMFVVYFILIVMVIIGIKLFVGEIEKDKGITGHVVENPPELVWETYYINSQKGEDLSVDSSGNIFVISDSINNPNKGLIVKYDKNGNFITESILIGQYSRSGGIDIHSIAPKNTELIMIRFDNITREEAGEEVTVLTRDLETNKHIYLSFRKLDESQVARTCSSHLSQFCCSFFKYSCQRPSKGTLRGLENSSSNPCI